MFTFSQKPLTAKNPSKHLVKKELTDYLSTYNMYLHLCLPIALVIPDALSRSHLADINAVVDGPGGLETFHHSLLEGLGQPVHPDEVLQVLGPGVVEGAARVHPLDDGSDITKHHSMH